MCGVVLVPDSGAGAVDTTNVGPALLRVTGAGQLSDEQREVMILSSEFGCHSKCSANTGGGDTARFPL